jgi:16S rRNA (cytidine1402-2'-O)-methyltransferase
MEFFLPRPRFFNPNIDYFPQIATGFPSSRFSGAGKPCNPQPELEAGMPSVPNGERLTSFSRGAPYYDRVMTTGLEAPISPGLYLVATPIGNLGDITLRALDVLRRADRIACEDTRQTQKLLNHFEITTPTVSCHQHNEHQRAVELIEALKAGQRIALVSDAGMPGISDPGSWLVTEAIRAGVAVIPIPGANAALSALVASGLSTDEFYFIGFLPEKAGARRSRLEALAAETQGNERERTLIFYEAPHRILETLTDMEVVFGADLRVVLARELTKIHEEFLRGTVAEARRELAGRDRIRGEFTLLVEARPRTAANGTDTPDASLKIADRVARLQAGNGIDEKEALKRLARELGRSKSELYRELQRERARRA